MRLSDSTRPIIFGFILAIGITLIQPYLAAGQSFGRSGTSGAFRMQGQRPFNRFGFFGVDGLGDQGDQQVIIIQHRKDGIGGSMLCRLLRNGPVSWLSACPNRQT